jgi:hypothetical protein
VRRCNNWSSSALIASPGKVFKFRDNNTRRPTPSKQIVRTVINRQDAINNISAQKKRNQCQGNNKALLFSSALVLSTTYCYKSWIKDTSVEVPNNETTAGDRQYRYRRTASYHPVNSDHIEQQQSSDRDRHRDPWNRFYNNNNNNNRNDSTKWKYKTTKNQGTNAMNQLSEWSNILQSLFLLLLLFIIKHKQKENEQHRCLMLGELSLERCALKLFLNCFTLHK